jgi:23S rRNA (uracil1939-C5)-methyltransferase
MVRRAASEWPEPEIKEAGAIPPPIAVVTGHIERMVPGGWSLLRDDDGVVLARGGLAGELVRVEIDRRKNGVRQGRVVDLLRRSAERTQPDCELFEVCGGCALLDHSARAEAEAKRSIVEDAMRRIARVGDDAKDRVLALRSSPSRAGLRRRARLHFDEVGMPGFFARGTHDVILAETCPALAPDLQSVLRDLREADWTLPGIDLAIACDDDGRVSFAVERGATQREAEAFLRRAVRAGVCNGGLLRGRRGRRWNPVGSPTLYGEVAPRVGGGPYRSDAATFTQATRFGGRAILEAVVQGAEGTSGRVIELFAGAGHLSLALAEAGHEVVAIESDAHSSGWLRDNALTSPWPERVTALRARVGSTTVEDLCTEHGPFELLVVDPPRSGVDGWKRVLDAADADHLVMVSCDPATGARDLRIAVDAGYTLEWVLPIDAFPRTSHVEWVARLSRKPRG